MFTRRQALIGATLVPVLPVFAQLESSVKAKLTNSQLIYLTPIKSDGEESACKGEVWFLYDGESDIYVVTQNEAWRANAIRQGLQSARIWVGEFGVWTRAGDSYRSAPELMLSGEVVTDPEVHVNVLKKMGGKYTAEWDAWGPRFRDGLADNSRVMLHYTIV